MPFCLQYSWSSLLSFGNHIWVYSNALGFPGRRSVNKMVKRFVFKIPGLLVFGKYIRRTLPGRHSVKIFALSSSLAFKAHIYLLSLPVQNFWVAIKKILTCLFGDENEQYFAINRSIAIHYCNAFHINSQSNLTLICDWSEMSKLWFYCFELVLWLVEKPWVALVEFVTL